MGELVQAKLADRRWMIKIGIALAIYILFQFILPPIDPITKSGMGVAGIFLATLFLWITVGIGWTSLLAVGLLGTTGVCTANDVFMHSWGNVMVPFLVGCFMLNYAMAETGLTRRFALWFITRKWLKNKPWGIMFMFFLSIMLIGLVSTSSPITVMYMAFAEQIFDSVGYKKGDKFTQAVILFIAWFAQMAICTTPISHTLIPMIIGYITNDFGITVSVGQFSSIFVCVGFALFVCFWLIFRYIVKPDVSKLANLDIDGLRASVTPMSRQEKVVAVVWAALIIFWVCPDLLKYIPALKATGVWMGKMGQTIPALIAAGILAACRIEGKPVLNVVQASAKIQWNTVYMMAALMGIGYVINLESCGITLWIRQSVGPVMTNLSPGVFTAVAILWVLAQTNLMSNTIAAMMYTVIIPMAVLIPGLNAVAVGLLIASSCNCAFATPGACPVCSMVVGSGWVEARFMVKYGWIMIPVCFLAYYFIGYPLACAVFPL